MSGSVKERQYVKMFCESSQHGQYYLFSVIEGMEPAVVADLLCVKKSFLPKLRQDLELWLAGKIL